MDRRKSPQRANRRGSRKRAYPVSQVSAERSRCPPSSGLSDKRTVGHRQVLLVKRAIQLIDRLLIVVAFGAPPDGFATTGAQTGVGQQGGEFIGRGEWICQRCHEARWSEWRVLITPPLDNIAAGANIGGNAWDAGSARFEQHERLRLTDACQCDSIHLTKLVSQIYPTDELEVVARSAERRVGKQGWGELAQCVG